ncbi:acyl-CoA mutase large subunit family protein [Desulfomonile tiedjei]|uniref:Methylmalonyl-CoA mutase family protein n=1 Tax=Desulfomonile tiedjei (strain ATCC 49306 / DSM 6799 / DCB-1) TaxID=706587 RepID=I4C7V3_DESTA|nr:methylmalonyl-CoA mutase family protein [Desulfomonile tiedjei]AFM25644.1 methylmalonyl-CoA mutase family protein [Desulfomonile tiedjei DSM 6799]
MSEEFKQKVLNWEAKFGETLKKRPERREEFRTVSELPVKRAYWPWDADEFDPESNLGVPGSYPFTRGVQPNMYRGRFWTMRQYAGFGSAEETNERFKYLISQGQTGLSVAFDLPTQIGYDSDMEISAGEVGKVGVAIDTIEDMKRLFDGIDLAAVSTSMTINSPAAILLAMYIGTAEEQGADPAKLRGTIQNDILKEYPARGTYIFPPKPSMRIITDIFGYCNQHVPQWNTISISGYHIREAGSTAVQEVAFTLANGIAYVQAAIDAGLDVNSFGERLSFFFNAHQDFLEEIAKFRAARRLWARIMKERFNATNPRAMMLRFHTQTAGCTLTAQQPENNVVRVAYQALSAVLGGTQSLHTNSRDEAFALPSQESVQIALRTQQIIGYETGAADSVDPLAGSYYIEALTDEIERLSVEYIKKIDEMGGAVRAVECGFIEDEIHESAYKFQKAIESEDRIIVGVNRFQTETVQPSGLLKVDPTVRERQIERLQQIRQQRNNAAVASALSELEKAARSTENVMPPIFKAVKERATLGEICNVLRNVFGEYTHASQC